MTAVTLDNLSKYYPGTAAPAVRGCTLELAAGGVTALLGPSGCGKTTILKLVAGLLAPSGGEIAFDGRSVLPLPPERRGAAMVFQNHLLFPYMSVGENVAFGLRMRGVLRREREREAAAMLERVQLAGFAQRRPRELSGGQQQRVALARALLARPRVLLLDEPLSNLDAHLRDEMRALIGALQRELGITTLVVTHDQHEAVTLADCVVLLFEGAVQQVGPPREFYTRPASARVARFFGGVNFVPATRRNGVFETALGRFPAAGCPLGEGPLLLTVRPEALHVAPPHAAGTPATVQERLYLGTQTRYTLRAGQLLLQALAPADAPFALGDTVSVVAPAERVWWVPDEA
jgi:ABC-type Fe3+/spermidine/putrescine transport system ATPase subunit